MTPTRTRAPHLSERRLLVAGPALLCLIQPGCWSPEWHRERADDAAKSIIRDTYSRALGREGVEFSIEPAAVSLRNRLLEDQDLPIVSRDSLGSSELEPIDYWPEDRSPTGPFEETGDPLLDDPEPIETLEIGLMDALRIAAANSSDYQSRKEDVYRAALGLDLARNAFNTTFTGLLNGSLDSTLTSDPRTRTTGLEGTGSLSATRVFQNGVTLSSLIGLDVVRLLTSERTNSLAVFWDSSISIPLMRGSGRHIVAEPLIQAERDTLYAILEFERFKRVFSVQIATSFLQVLQQVDQINNAEQNYRSLIASVRQLKGLAEAGKRPGLEADQAVQDELRARDRWVSAIQSYLRQLDAFRIDLGLPPDAEIHLDRNALERLGKAVREALSDSASLSSSVGARPAGGRGADAPIELPPPGYGTPGPLEVEPVRAVRIALEKRLDLAVTQGRVFDAQRAVVVAADGLRPELTLLGTSSLGQRRSLAGAALPNSKELNYNDATYEALLDIDLATERTAERIAYRNSWIDLERSVRDLQDLEDSTKQEVRQALRSLLEAREGQRTQAAAVDLAEERVRSTRLLLDAGRIETRDLLDAQESLISAQNDLTAALIAYRIAELALLRDLGLLEIDDQGLWQEINHHEIQFNPDA